MGDFKGGGFNNANVDVLKGHFGWLFQVIWLERQFDRMASIISVVTICIKLVSTYKYITINCIDEEQIKLPTIKNKEEKDLDFPSKAGLTKPRSYALVCISHQQISPFSLSFHSWWC